MPRTFGTGASTLALGSGAALVLACGCGETGAVATTISIAEPCGACEPAPGFWLTTVPGLVSLTDACAPLPSVSPACSNVARASVTLVPTTLGTLIALGPPLTSALMVVPGWTLDPPAGSWSITVCAGISTLEIGLGANLRPSFCSAERASFSDNEMMLGTCTVCGPKLVRTATRLHFSA